MRFSSHAATSYQVVGASAGGCPQGVHAEFVDDVLATGGCGGKEGGCAAAQCGCAMWVGQKLAVQPAQPDTVYLG